MDHSRSYGRIGTTPLIIIAAAALALGLWAGTRWMSPSPPPTLSAAVMYPAPLAVGDFELRQANGQPFGRANLLGHWTIAFFGFTHCPDICPTTLATFKQVWAELARQGATDRVQFVFVSVDPERDTPEKLAAYVAFFDKDFIAATGPDEQLNQLTRSLGLIYARNAGPAGGYDVDHSASAVIIDPAGRRAGLFRPPFKADLISSDIQSLLEPH